MICVVAFVTVEVTVSVGEATVDRTVFTCSIFVVNVLLFVSTEDERDDDGLDVVCCWVSCELCVPWDCCDVCCCEGCEGPEEVEFVVVGELPPVPVVWVPVVLSVA